MDRNPESVQCINTSHVIPYPEYEIYRKNNNYIWDNTWDFVLIAL